MDVAFFPDFAASIRYALTSRAAPDGGVEVVLDLFRGSVPALTRTIASVRPGQAGPLLETCRRHLERLGAHAVVQTSADFVFEPAETSAWIAPLTAFDWMFAG